MIEEHCTVNLSLPLASRQEKFELVYTNYAITCTMTTYAIFLERYKEIKREIEKEKEREGLACI